MSSFNNTIQQIKGANNTKAEEHLTESKELKYEPHKFKKRANKDQYKFNLKMAETIYSARSTAQKSQLEKVKSDFKEGEKLLNERQKHILLPLNWSLADVLSMSTNNTIWLMIQTMKNEFTVQSGAAVWQFPPVRRRLCHRLPARSLRLTKGQLLDQAHNLNRSLFKPALTFLPLCPVDLIWVPVLPVVSPGIGEHAAQRKPNSRLQLQNEVVWRYNNSAGSTPNAHPPHNECKLLAQVKAACIRIPTNSTPSPAPARPQAKPAQPATTCPNTPDSTSSESEDESFVCGGSTTDEHVEVDQHQLQIEADLDDISSYADTDADDKDVPDTANNTWHNIYTLKSPNQNVCDYFMSRFYQYLVHVEGGAHSQQQAVIHTRQVHNILSTLYPAGSDLACLACRRGLTFGTNSAFQNCATNNSQGTPLRRIYTAWSTSLNSSRRGSCTRTNSWTSTRSAA